MRSAVGVPQRVGAEIVIPLGCGVDLQVHAAVAAIDVAEQRRRQQAVIQTGVEDAPLRLVVAVDAHAPQFLFPRGHGLRMHAGEVEVGKFGIQVGQRVVRAHRRDADLDQQRRLGGIRIMQCGLEMHAIGAAQPGGEGLVFVVQLYLFERARQPHGEVDIAALGPLIDTATAGDGLCVDHAQLRIAHAGGDAGFVLHAMAQVQQHMRGLALGEVVPVQAGARGGGEFGMHAAVLEPHAVVARRGRFIRMIVARAIAGVGIIQRAGHQLDLAGGWHQQHIEHVANAGAG